MRIFFSIWQTFVALGNWLRMKCTRLTNRREKSRERKKIKFQFIYHFAVIASFSDGVRHKVGHSRQYQSKHHHEHHLGPFFEGPLNTTAGALHVGVHLYTEAVLNCRVGMLKDKTVSWLFFFFLTLLFYLFCVLFLFLFLVVVVVFFRFVLVLSQSVNFIYYRYLCARGMNVYYNRSASRLQSTMVTIHDECIK